MTAEQENNPTTLDDRTIPESLPVLPLRDTVAFPVVITPLLVGQQRSIRLVDDVMRGNRLALFVAQKTKTTEQAGPNDLYQIGTVGVIDQLTRTSDGSLRLVVQGLEKAKIREFVSTDPYLVATLETLPESNDTTTETEALRRAVLDLLRRLITLIDDLPTEIATAAENLSDARQLIYLVALMIPLATQVRQELLEIDFIDAKLKRLLDLLQYEVTIRELGHKITSDTQERVSKAQRDYFLREQVRSIQKELGEGNEQPEIAEFKKRIEEVGLTEEARKEVERELERLSTTPPASSEYGIIRTYLDWMTTLPWAKLSGETIDVNFARQVLDQDHFDLEKIKERLLEYLAVKKLRQDRNPPAAVNEAADKSHTTRNEPILCLVGPPGVGKTSLGQSIARALGRRFARVSLGGLHDESEIRGHRRTYIGAMPGKIIQNLKRAGTRDPVFMLDEIDKVGADWRGDPASALLEVLDPSQNYNFVDNYLSVAFDLSEVLFIATANTLDTVPPPLLDRMEVLQLSGYTDAEKIQIAKRYLIPKQRSAHGLKEEEISFTEKSIQQVIRGYTREAGVRNLDREVANVCRKVAKRIAEGKTEPVKISQKMVTELLGRERFFDEAAERTSRPGVATGLAWTPTGGDVLFIEATLMPSLKERLIVTGKLGDVMRESAQAALSYVRSNAQTLGIDSQALEGKALHLHVPAGATPKDGPSAGVTMVVALVSLLSGRLVSGDVAMTGEITLRGKILPVGGIKEKVLAARRAGIKTVILPKRNEHDIDDIPKELRQTMKYKFIDTAEEALQYALEPKQKT